MLVQESSYDRARQSQDIAAKSPKYEPLNKMSSGGILAKQISIDDLDAEQVRLGSNSALAKPQAISNSA